MKTPKRHWSSFPSEYLNLSSVVFVHAYNALGLKERTVAKPELYKDMPNRNIPPVVTNNQIIYINFIPMYMPVHVKVLNPVYIEKNWALPGGQIKGNLAVYSIFIVQ